MTITLDLINTILFWILLYLLLWQIYFLFLNGGIPNIKTAPAIRKEIIRRLEAEYKRYTPDKPDASFTIVDPGCGNGDFTREIARALPDAQIIGVERSRLAYWRCRLMQKWTGLRNIQYIRNDFAHVDFSNANAVVFFLLGRLMYKIRGKLEEDLKPGTLVISNMFEMQGDWTPEEEVAVKNYTINQKFFYVYRAP